RRFQAGDDSLADIRQQERVSGKGDLTRHRTISGTTGDDSGGDLDSIRVDLDFDDGAGTFGTVLSVHGLNSRVLGDDGHEYRCAIRQLLRSLNTDQRHVVAAGDRVAVRIESPPKYADDIRQTTGDPTSQQQPASPAMLHPGIGMIESVLPRRSVLSRNSRRRRHVIVANVDYLLIIASCAQPMLKPGLIDRYLLTAAQCQIQPVICLNKIDLVDPATLQPLIGTYTAMGFQTIASSAITMQGIDRIRALIKDRQTVLSGQSGVGKSSLLNAIQPGLGLRVGTVSEDNNKGRHTTTGSSLIPLEQGGAVFDTPGIRQFQLWDITQHEVSGLMPDFRPYVNGCRYADCLHIAEDGCAVKNAVADNRIDARRYDSYCHLIEDELAST
ncbi:MAG: ribosome small subunit-dependent GTPase A, partial [Planctomycetota bacterium]